MFLILLMQDFCVSLLALHKWQRAYLHQAMGHAAEDGDN